MTRARDRLDGCLQQVLTFVELSRTPFAIVDLGGVLQTAVAACPRRSGEVTLSLQGEPLVVRGLPDYLRQAFEFILDNAVQAVQRGGNGRVLVRAWREGGDCRVLIKDNGPGMSPETLQRALEPFFTTKVRGSGLGLSAAYCIIRSHEGQVQIGSELGEGTRVTVVLPTASGGS
jgi:signal transduction histidine kinase